MSEHDLLAERFETQRGHLRAVAYRMLGSMSEADDAVQEAWLRVSRAETTQVENLPGFLTTVVARVCLDQLRSRKARREEPLEPTDLHVRPESAAEASAEDEAVLADSVGLALLVVLDTLSPPERLAFVLHDLFAISFEEIGSIVGRTPTAARQLASRARRRVQGRPAVPEEELDEQRTIIQAFLGALRRGDVDAMLLLLDPELVVNAEFAPGQSREIRGAKNWVKGALAFRQQHGSVSVALVDGSVGLLLAPHGQLSRVLRFQFFGGKIAGVEVIADPARLRTLDIAVIDASTPA
ncbi:MAG: sigma-70 family RNA polymerase sigma factor [Polyangiales bacterium]